MQGYLKWKVRGPDIHNPFAPPISNVQLNRLVHEDDYLRENIELRCTCDGYEVMLLTNLNKPRVRCDHPCLNVLTRREIIDAVGRHGLDEMVQTELKKIREDLAQELERRSKEKEKDAYRETSGKTLKQLRKEREEHVRSQGTRADDSGSDDRDKTRFRSLLR